ncbi:MAG TPA: Fe-S-containing hydro-lyase [Spirochaetales bacterium]|nr:Fe-S-containing hydro-lyase [Spirochaetales bacterium]
MIRLSLPLGDEEARSLRAGDRVLLSGVLLTGRDAAHKRLVELMERGGALPVDLSGQTIYYVGPCPAAPGRVIGSAGPTTSGRMDVYTPRLLDAGLKGMIGKGPRSRAVIDAIMRNGAVYFAAIGEAGALLARAIKEARVVAFGELGPEAIYRLRVEDFPVTVAVDANGADLYSIGRNSYRRHA